jgi:hypothetical protein
MKNIAEFIFRTNPTTTAKALAAIGGWFFFERTLIFIP